MERVTDKGKLIRLLCRCVKELIILTLMYFSNCESSFVSTYGRRHGQRDGRNIYLRFDRLWTD